MLTSLPPRLLHRVRDAAAYVHDLAQLGLALLCPCEDDHGAGGRWLDEDDQPRTFPACACDVIPAPRPHQFASGVPCWCGTEHWRMGLPVVGQPGVLR